jgi:hypothetical protein
MIQIHKVADLEAAIMLGVLIPKDAPKKSRHRFWISDRRLDVYLNNDRTLFLHWVKREKKGGPVVECEHPHPLGFRRGLVYMSGSAYWRYGGVWSEFFTPSPNEGL